ncbi:MAG: hypothetical protein GX344_04305 [Intrasporangiaceae bacterium]|nr:hypothetical protein [Intrasporangiaceae bacterium]
MTEFLDGLSVPLAVLALWAFALVRGGFYYALGRFSRGKPGGRLDQWADRITSGYVAVAEEKVDRLGPKGIVLTYPLYGVSGSVQIVSGGLRMHLVPFYLALGAVSLPWATMQAVVGVAAIQAVVMGYAPWVIVVTVLLLTVWIIRRRRDRRLAEADSAAAAGET